jgi:hypothetical protein
MDSMRFDLPEAFGPISTFSGSSVISSLSGPKESKFCSCKVRISFLPSTAYSYSKTLVDLTHNMVCPLLSLHDLVRLLFRAQIELIVEELGIGSVEPRARGDGTVLKASSGF